jgi:glycosyltransferase involved in cell wall biosynthesis
MKIALVTNIVPPYRKPLFEEIGKHCDLTVICSAANESDREWQGWDEKNTGVFRTIILKGLSFKTKHGFFYLQTELVSVLRTIRPDIVINSSFSLNTLWGSLYAKMARKPSLIWSEATCFSERKQSLAQRWFRKMLVRLNDVYVPSGIEAKEFLVSLGAVKERCFTAVDAIEDIRKSPEYQKITREVNLVREKFPGLRILYAGMLIRPKGLDFLLKAYEKVQDEREMSLLLMGSGAMGDELKSEVARKNLKNVKFLGFKNEREKWVYFLASNIFVFPTQQDVWGLVVNEAMLCGLPVICSKFAGCCKDLIEDEKTGFVIDPNDTESFAHVLRKVITNDGLRSAMSESARGKACKYSIEKSAKGFLRAFTFARKAPKNQTKER